MELEGFVKVFEVFGNDNAGVDPSCINGVKSLTMNEVKMSGFNLHNITYII